MFANLFKSFTLPDFFSHTDKYEEYLRILDELGSLHISILQIISGVEKGATGADIMRQLVKWDAEKGKQYETIDDYSVSAALENLDNLRFIRTTHTDGMILGNKNRNAAKNYALTPLGTEFIGFILES